MRVSGFLSRHSPVFLTDQIRCPLLGSRRFIQFVKIDDLTLTLARWVCPLVGVDLELGQALRVAVLVEARQVGVLVFVVADP